MLTINTVSYRFNLNREYTRIMEAKKGIRQGDPISPLLFVLLMQYLSRILQQLNKILEFKFHSRCKKLNITNLSFADDLLIFTRGDTVSMEVMLKKIEKFSKSTGLRMNPRKCFVYFGAFDDVTRSRIKEMTGFMEGTLPFRYLGIPLTSKKL